MSIALILGLLVFGANRILCAQSSTSECAAGDATDESAMVQMGLRVTSPMNTGRSHMETIVNKLSRREGATLGGGLVIQEEWTPDEIKLFGVGENIALPEVGSASNTPTPELPLNHQKLQGSEVKLNGAGDLAFLLAGVQFDVELIIFFIICFTVGLCFLPSIYAFRATGANLQGDAQKKAVDAPYSWAAEEKSLCMWVFMSFAYSREQLIQSCGLDAAMLIAFTDMALEILTVIGVPFLLLGCPIYYFQGGMRAGDDYLSRIGIGNVVHKSWIFYPVACTTWFVVIFTQWRLFQWMRMFIEYRGDWLQKMPSPQCSTVLVEGIPDEYCSDAALKKYFQTIFGGVKEAFVVKKIGKLEALVEEYISNYQLLKETLFIARKNPEAPPPRFPLTGQDKKDVYYSEMERLAKEITEQQRVIQLEARKAPEETDIYATSGFVTFETRSGLEMAIGIRLRLADNEFVMEYPPEPADIIWSDLEQTVAGRTFWAMVGYACIAGLFFAYMPIVLAISQAADIDTLESKIPLFKKFTVMIGSYRDTLAGTLASLGLTVMTSMLPTFLMWIFNMFFTLKAYRWAQLHLQTYYFWFLILFVLLVTCVGSNLAKFASHIAQKPSLIFTILADQMPLTTHFYMNFVAMQWVTHSMNFTRYINVMKYLLFKRFMEPEDARCMSEPEDQDYYGMGSRSARFSLMLVIGLVFSSICPLLVLLVWINFMVCRLFYGYLIPYAETRKSDLGGSHFALQLIHVHLGLLIYIIMMSGILWQRASNCIPAAISAISFFWWFVSFTKFRRELRWETLPYADVTLINPHQRRESSEPTYAQAALDPQIIDKIKDQPFAE